MNQEIEQLENLIKEEESQLFIKKLLLKEAKRAAKKSVPFPATRVGKFLFGTAELTTRWTRGVNEEMFEALTNPEGWRTKKLNTKAEKLLSQCDLIEDNKHKHAQSVACKISVFLSKNEEYLDKNIVDELKENRERLRSDHSKTVKERINRKAEEIINDKFSNRTFDFVDCGSSCDFQQATSESEKVL